jgi:hypothetical protein
MREYIANNVQTITTDDCQNWMQQVTSHRLAALCALILALQAPAAPPMKDFMGVCGHTVLFKPELYRAVGQQVRDYHPVDWDLGQNPRNYPPFPFAMNGVNWKDVYGSWIKSGYDIDACLMFETLNTNQWANPETNAFAYGFSFARAFGPGAPTPLVRTVEIGNEPGKFGDVLYRRVFENLARGIRQADPELKIATCAVVTGKSHEYAKSITCFEGLTNLFDVITLHSYAQLENWPTWRRSYPEDSKLPNYLKDIRDVCAWRDAHAPGKPVWITEFGYDASSKKPNASGDFKDWVGNTETEQAQWLVRSWLLFSTMPVDRAYMYFFNDDDQPQLHGASGLTRQFKPKPVLYATAHLYRSLGEYRFAKEIKSDPGKLTILEYERVSDAKDRVWVAWSPTGSNRIETMTLPQPPGRWLRGERMPLTAEVPAAISVEALGGAKALATVEVTESPLYLWWKAD